MTYWVCFSNMKWLFTWFSFIAFQINIYAQVVRTFNRSDVLNIRSLCHMIPSINQIISSFRLYENLHSCGHNLCCLGSLTCHIQSSASNSPGTHCLRRQNQSSEETDDSISQLTEESINFNWDKISPNAIFCVISDHWLLLLNLLLFRGTQPMRYDICRN